MDNRIYSSDAPVHIQEEDGFSRWSFSERVAQVISKRSDPSSIVIGLYGKWGDGKTSVLNFIESSLASDEKVICIKFNPWRFGTEDQLLMAFFHEIAEALNVKLDTAGDKLKVTFRKVFKPLASLAGTAEAGEIIDSFISMPDIDEFKERTERLLERAEKRVLILIDDVDRLDKSEIHALFRLVKLTADFKYTSYILAFDKDIVASSLQDRYSNSHGNSGDAFLEKIIQIPLHLPLVEKDILRQFCFDGINEALSVAEIDLNQEQVQRFVKSFNLAFDDCLTTPRRAKLYGNILMFSLPILKGEINVVDLMLIEGIRVFCPELYEVLRVNQSLFTGTFSGSFGDSYNDEHKKEQVNQLIENSLGQNDSANKENFIKLLKELFPKLQSVYGNVSFGSDWYSAWNENQRICSDSYFSRYFTYSISKNDISDLEVSNMIQELDGWDSSISSNPLAQLILSNNPNTVIKKLGNKFRDINEETAEALAIAICQVSNNFTQVKGATWTDSFSQSAMLLSDLFQTVDNSRRVKMIKASFDATNDLEYKVEVFRWLRHEGRDNSVEDCLAKDQMNEIGKYLASEIVTYLETNRINDISISFAKLFWIVHRYHSSTYLNQYAQEKVNDINSVQYLISSYVPIWTTGTGRSGKEDFTRNEYDTLSKYIDASILMAAVRTHFPNELNTSDKYPSRLNNEDTDEELLFIRQFIWLYYNEILRQENSELDNTEE